jgi:uncharacterized protein YbaP (TraB family)
MIALRPFLAAFGVAVACLLQASCASPPRDAGSEAWSARPLVWRATGPDGSTGVLMLLGSVHLGRSGVHDFGTEVQGAYEASDELVVEVDLSTLTANEISGVSAKYVMLPVDQTLADVISPESYARLTAYLAERKVSVTSFERLKPWAVGMSIALLEYQAAGLHGDYGVDQHFIDAAEGESRPIRALETMESQLAAIDGISQYGQQLMLDDTLVRTGDDPNELVEAWEHGDEKKLESLLFGPLAENPEFAEFYDAVFFRRNEAMTAKLVEMARDGKQRFVVLGAAHMIGDRGIPALLSARGFEVERFGGSSGAFSGSHVNAH